MQAKLEVEEAKDHTPLWGSFLRMAVYDLPQRGERKAAAIPSVIRISSLDLSVKLLPLRLYLVTRVVEVGVGVVVASIVASMRLCSNFNYRT